MEEESEQYMENDEFGSLSVSREGKWQLEFLAEDFNKRIRLIIEDKSVSSQVSECLIPQLSRIMMGLSDICPSYPHVDRISWGKKDGQVHEVVEMRLGYKSSKEDAEHLQKWFTQIFKVIGMLDVVGLMGSQPGDKNPLWQFTKDIQTGMIKLMEKQEVVTQLIKSNSQNIGNSEQIYSRNQIKI